LTYAILNNRPGDILVSTSPAQIPQKKVIYLNNRDLLKQIHLSKNTYCSFLDPKNDHQYDIILPSLAKINQRTVAEARRNRSDRIKKETGVIIDQKKIPNTDLVFRVTSWEHIPAAPKKIPKSATKKKKIEDIFDLELIILLWLPSMHLIKSILLTLVLFPTPNSRIVVTFLLVTKKCKRIKSSSSTGYGTLLFISTDSNLSFTLFLLYQ
jgi:hypothetical protein